MASVEQGTRSASRLRRQERDAERHGLLGAGHVARRGRHAHERLELALGDDRDRSARVGCGKQSTQLAPMGFAKWKLVMRIPVFR